MAEVGGSVSNSFGFRSVVSDVGQAQDAAAKVANGAIDAVDGVLDALKTTVSDGLGEVFSAITALGNFKPGSVTFSYQIPDYIESAFSLPGSMPAGTALATPTAPATGTFSFPLGDVTPRTISATAPDVPATPAITAPTPQNVGGEPAAPADKDIVVPVAPVFTPPSALNPQLPAAPGLKKLVAPNLALPGLPEYVLPELELEPELPAISLSYIPTGYSKKRMFSAFKSVPKWMGVVRKLATGFGSRLSERDVTSASTKWSSRGFTLDADVQFAQVAYRSNMALLMNGGEARQRDVDDFLTLRSTIVFELDAVLKEWRQKFDMDYIGQLKQDFESDKLFISTIYELFKSQVALYNAAVTEFGIEVTLYRNAVESAVANVEKWKAEVEAESSKTKLNSQLAATYAATAQAETTKASLYETNVRALFANIDAYRARMEAFATQADVARTKLATYKGSVDAYIGGLSSYKAQFDMYEAQARGVAAQNQAEEAKAKISIARMQAAGADASAKEVEIQIASEKLKLEARTKSADFENQRLKNALETVIAQVEGDIGRSKVMEWGANTQLTAAENDAITAEAQAAARYYNAASDSAFRASEQALRAMMSAAQASNIAQEAAGRSAASVAQGAYSAMHVNATLQGSGRSSGSEDQDARNNRTIGDFLNYTESREQILSA